MRENPAIFEALDVSNPLRLEGDGGAGGGVGGAVPVSNPRRLEGDLEGDVDDACNLHRTPEFLIHYGWRGTLITAIGFPAQNRF